MSGVLALSRYCLESGVKHFFLDCSLNLEKKAKETLKLLETISSSGNESEEVMQVKAMMRAQAWKQATQPIVEEEKSMKLSPKSWKARRKRRVATRKKREEKTKEEEKVHKKDSLPKGGLVLVDKVFKPLKSMLYAYEANQTNKER